MTKFLTLLLLVFGSLFCDAISFTVEHAVTNDELKWGLMGRKEIPPNHGMLLHYPEVGRHGVWMFNCYVPLSVAFLDEEGRIVEIHDLKAYPEMMKNTDPISSINDLETLNLDDPTVQFFISKSVLSSKPVKYALEMPLGWFRENEVAIGEFVHSPDFSQDLEASWAGCCSRFVLKCSRTLSDRQDEGI